MSQKKITLLSNYILILFLILFLSKCGNNNLLVTDPAAQEITIAFNNYYSEDWETRLNSIKVAAKYSNTVHAKNSLLLLLKAINDSHSEIKIEALKILKKMKAPAVEDKIGVLALSDANPNVRVFALLALEEYGNIKNEDIFIKSLDDKDWLIQETSLAGLMKINDPEIQTKHLDIIIRSINSKNTSIRLTALSNINIRNPLIYSELSRIINNKKSGLSILKAALLKIKGYKLDNKTKTRIIELLTHSDKDIRLLSFYVLKQEEPAIDK